MLATSFRCETIRKIRQRSILSSRRSFLPVEHWLVGNEYTSLTEFPWLPCWFVAVRWRWVGDQTCTELDGLKSKYKSESKVKLIPVGHFRPKFSSKNTALLLRFPPAPGTTISFGLLLLTWLIRRFAWSSVSKMSFWNTPLSLGSI